MKLLKKILIGIAIIIVVILAFLVIRAILITIL